MRMGSYREVVAKLQPIVPTLFEAFTEAVELANTEHTEKGYARSDDPWFYAHNARRDVLHRLNTAGLIVRDESAEKPQYPMSALRINYDDLAVWMFKRPRPNKGTHEIPVPGRSDDKRRFWRQEPMLPGMATDNILLLWSEDRGALDAAMTLVRPLGGDHRRDSLQVAWVGSLTKEMATFSGADLNELEPTMAQPELGAEDAG